MPGTSRVHQAIHGERWSRTDNLLAGIYDLTARANWQRGGNKRVKRPTPLPRPGLNPGKRFGTESMPIDEWQRRRAARFPEGRCAVGS